MILANSKHIKLLQDELIYQTHEFEKLLRQQAARMFIDNKLFLCRFQGYDERRGNLIVKFDHNICFAPRKNEILQCFVSTVQNENVTNWGGLTYKDLRTNITSQFESKTVFFNYHKDYTIVGLSGVGVHDVAKFEKNALVFLAPADPPLAYLQNLVNYLAEVEPGTNKFLDVEMDASNWNPEPLVSNDGLVKKIQSDFIETDTIIIQGPPGTGKTYLMAQLCSSLLRNNCKILVTSLTNRALIELAEKEHLQADIALGNVYKTSLSADELKNKKIKGIIGLKSISQQQPPLLLSTYYIMSHLATKAVEDNHFDYVIVEEASQAFLSTIAMARKLGKKIIIIGDIKQLEPIFHKECSLKDPNGYHWMVCGLKTLSYYLQDAKKYILTDSFRLTNNSVKATNAFYNGMLNSMSNVHLPLNVSDSSLMNFNGGTTLKKVKMPDGRIPSLIVNKLIIDIINEVKLLNKTSEIAILAFNRDTVRSLQKEVFSKCKITEGVLVETIDRIQGLTTDFCIFFIPKDSIPFSLQPNRFNVATSRARFCTLIIADETIDHFIKFSEEISNYFKEVKVI